MMHFCVVENKAFISMALKSLLTLKNCYLLNFKVVLKNIDS